MRSLLKGATGKTSAKGTELSVEELFGRIQQSVAAGDITTAESLREALLHSDTVDIPLMELVASAELIEEAKLAGIEKEHLQIWEELYETLSPEEKTVFFYSLVEKIFPQKSILIRQGNLNDSLFFLEKGHLAAIFTKEKEHSLVLQVGKGGFFGENTFFGMTVCTSSVVTRSEVVVKILKKEKVSEWQEKAPGLYAKLESYCRVNDRYEEAFERKRQEKSRFQRVTVSGLVTAEILNAEMKGSGKQFRAAVEDLSRGGACFSIKSSTREVAESLLAKSLKMLFAVGRKNHPVEFVAKGRVVKIKFHMENDYSVHVKFTSPLGEEKINLLQVT